MGENTRKDRRTKVLSMTVRYRSATLGEFIEHHSYDVSRGGMFIKTPSPFPPGTLLKFEVKIADEQRVMQGVGRVVWKRDLDGNTPGDPAGMGIKFIKIDDASRAVIDKLVEGRMPGQEGAFEHLPEARPRMFPSTPPSELAPEDRTVIKPATELLKDALKKSGEEPAEPAASDNSAVRRAEASGASQQPVAKKSVAKAETRKSSQQDEKSKPVERKESEKKSSASEAKVRESQVRPTSAHEEEGRGRAFVSILVAVAVAAGIYLVTKQGTTTRDEERPEPEPVPAIQPPTPEVVPDVPEPVPPPEPTSTAVPIGVLAPESDDVAVPMAPETVAEPVAPKPPAPKAPAPKPRPVPKPKPTPPPAPETSPVPAPSPAPVAPASEPATPAVPAPTSSTSGE